MTASFGRIARGAALALAVGAGPAAAQMPAAVAPPSLTAAQFESLDRALQLWTGSLGLSVAGLPAASVVAEGDHYRLTRPLAPTQLPPDVSMSGGTLTAAVRSLDGGRWQLTDIHVGMPVSLHAVLPKQGTNPGGPFALTFDMPEQTGSATLDPTLATASQSEFTAASTRGDVRMPAVSASFRSGALDTHGDWQPAGSGRIDRDSRGSLSDLSIDFAGKQKVSVAIQAFRTDVSLRGLSPDVFARFMQRLRAAQGQLPTSTPGLPKPDMTAPQRTLLRGLLTDLGDIASAVDLHASAEGIAVSAADHLIRLHRIAVAEGVAAPGGHADAYVRLTVEGLDSPDIPPAIAQNYLPHRLVLAPRVSGPSTAALYHLIDDALAEPAPSSQAMQAEAAALLAHGPLNIGLDELSFDVGPTYLSATGAVQVAGTTGRDVTGSGVIRAKNFDALMQRTTSDPMLQQAAPVLIFLKGIGQADATGSVTWKLAYAGGHLLVNGTDLSQMLPHH